MLTYAIRHAESLANAQLDPGLDSALSPLGQRQVAALVRRFQGVQVNAIYCSPFLRSIQTAVPLAKALGLPPRIRPELFEFQSLPPESKLDPGLDGVDAITARHQGTVPCPDYKGSMVWPPGDETIEDLVARMQALARSLKQRWQGADESVILISHGSPIARLIEAWLTDRPGPNFRFTLDNAAVSALRFTDGLSGLICLNEVSHLRGLPLPQAANYREDGSIHPHWRVSHW